MKKFHRIIRSGALLAIVASILCPSEVRAAKFSRAKVTKVVNDVKLLSGSSRTRPASSGAVVSGTTAVLTGQKSRAELQFPDESLVRLGSNSVFSFSPGKRDVEMKQGTMLMQVPKSLGRTQVKTAAVTAAITGTTILLEYVPPVLDKNGGVIRAGKIKIIVVEGSLEFFLNASPGKKLSLKPGEMVAFPSNARALPKKLNFDIPRLVKTSSLFNMGGLPDLPKIRREIATQTQLKKSGKLVDFKVANNKRTRGPAAGGGPDTNVRRTRVTVNSAPTPPPSSAPVRRPPANVGNSNSPPPPPTPVPLPDRPDRTPPGTGAGAGT